jgi:uncharacterized LabA/DUF88 family protein
MSDRPARIALLIDADNSPASKIDVILAELAKAGVTNIRRAYGNWKKDGLKGWEAVLHEYAIRPIQQFDYSKGKNATDMSMVIDAMDLLYTDHPEAFGIVSSDSDFTPLVLHLKAKGAQVFGFGAAKTPLPFVAACSRFLYLEHLGVATDAAVDEPAAKPAESAARKTRGAAKGKAKDKDKVESSIAQPDAGAADAGTPAAAVSDSTLRRDTAALKQDARLVTLLRNAVEAAAGDDGWSKLGVVGKQIGNQASFDPRNYGYATLSKLIAATQLFETRDEGTSMVAIRDRRHTKAAGASTASRRAATP